MDEAIKTKIIQARVSLLMHQPFWGILVTRLIMKEVSDEDWLPTAATDGRHLYYNPEFISKLTPQQLIFVLAHEVQHCVYDHMSRRNGRLKRLWNVAADFVINYELVESKIGDMPTKEPIKALYDVKYANKCAEEVYELLLDDPESEKYAEFDVHMEQGDGLGTGMTQEEWDALSREFKQAVLQAAKSCDAGQLPAGIKRMIKDLTEPQMSWKEMLNLSIKSLVKNDYTWTRPSKRSIGSNVYLPSMKHDDTIDVVVSIDTSGSMTNDMIRDLLSEVKGIMEQFTDFKVQVWTFDTKVYGHQVYTECDGIENYEPEGGGGTEFACNWEYMKENEIVPNTFIMFTDGYNNSREWGDSDYCDTIFVIHGNKERNIVAPFGTTVYYE